jgi:ATP-dependent Clp protease protease subunit
MAKLPKDDNQFIRVDDKIDEALLENRRLFISNAIDNETAEEFIRKLWYLEFKDPGEPILVVINSPGGSVDDGFAIWDQVKMIKSPITTLVTGLAASMGSVLSLCADNGRRFATENARIMIHQPRNMGVIRGQASDLDIHAKEIIKTRKKLVDIYVQKTGKDAETIERAIDRDTWMSSAEAKDYGLLDKIVSSYADLE